MRVMVDTNVIISAILREDSLPDIVLNKVCEKCDLILCDYIINECYDVARRRFPLKLHVLVKLFAKLRYELVLAPKLGKVKMRDIKDQPILYAALQHNVDVLITGDKHFLEIDIKELKIYTPAEYSNLYCSQK